MAASGGSMRRVFGGTAAASPGTGHLQGPAFYIMCCWAARRCCLFTPRQGRRSLRRQLLWGAAIALGFAAALTGVIPSDGAGPVSLLPPRDNAAGAVLGTVVLQALIAGAEELFFRGFLPQELEALALPPWLTAAVPALLFGGLHFFMNGNVIQLCISTAIAAYYLLLRRKGAGLVTLAWAHLLHNLIFFYLIGI